MDLIDLHVHTPASSCYQCKGDLTLEGHYLNVLSEYAKRNIKMIAITDHNTLKGYKKLISIKEDLQQKLKAANDEEKQDLQQKLDLYEKVHIIPGIEFTAYPHIHILMLFDENEDFNKIDEFLLKCGYDEEKQGRDLDNILNIDVVGIIEECRKLNGITIAAHIDRETGLLYWLEEENIEDREIFNNEGLTGVHILKEETKKYLEENVINENRNDKFIYINASDFHNEMDDMEKRATFMNIKEYSFKGLKEVFENAKENIKLQWE